MKARRRWILFVSLLIVFQSHIALGQLAVTDAGVTLQTTITSINMVWSVTNQILELTGLGELVLGDEMTTDLTQLAAVATEAQALGTDLATIQIQLTGLFSLDSAPSSSRELQERLGEIRRLTFRVYMQALRVQTLLQSTVSALRHMVRLIEAIGDLVGNQQSNQTLVQLETKLTIELHKLKEQTAAYHRAQVVDRLAEPLTMESMHNINRELMSDWPRD